MITLDTELTTIGRIQQKYHPKLAKLGLLTVEDLLRHLPSRYDDLSLLTTIEDLTVGAAQTTCAIVEKVSSKRIPGKRKMHITEATFSDATGTMKAIWFNQPYIEKNLPIGQEMRLSGKVQSDKRGVFMSAPDTERAARTPTSTGRIVPTYPETAGLTSKWLRWQIQTILGQCSAIDDPLPPDVRELENFPDLARAFQMIHFPTSQEDVHTAQTRFAFEDLFVLQTVALTTRARLSHEKAHTISFDEELVKDFVASLSFTLTDAQRKSSFQILTDISKDVPMNRLLNGDVGAGKTLVATIAALEIAKSGAQVAILAPTEILAGQHFITLTKLLTEHDIEMGLMTGSQKMYGSCEELIQTTTRTKILEKIGNGSIKIIIGTHAIIQDDVDFDKLALVVVDEQHRFGVAQRSSLINKTRESVHGKVPHFLTMTATPIPRTFALALFGDLSVSLLDEKPAERKPIKTATVVETKKKNVYSFITDELSEGRQGYVILPLVEDSKVLAHVKSAKEEHIRLQKEVFPDFTIGLLHGRMKPKEKEQVMQDFKNKKIHLLVATSVVEVGVDVPNATIMIIENAERFGLSQLHQFRGRIGRGDQQSYCFLFSTAKGNARLKALEKHNDGFKLAEIDLELRGPGEFIGTRQSGLPDGAMKNIANIKLVEKTRQHARNTLITDPGLKHNPALRKALARLNQKVHLE